MKKLFYLLLPASVAIAAFLLIGFLRPTPQVTTITSEQPALTFDAWSEQINTVSYDAAGNIDYTLQADRQLHLFNDITELDNPLIQLFQESGAHWNIVAESGRILPAASEQLEATRTLELSGNVRVYNTDTYGNLTQVNTDFLTLDPGTRTASTDREIQLETTNIMQTATGMVADLSADQITFLEDTQGRYEQP